MLPRTLEPEVMDTAEEAADYDAMDHFEVNRRFVDDWGSASQAMGHSATARLRMLDVGTGTALIPIEFCRSFPNLNMIAIDLATHPRQVQVSRLWQQGAEYVGATNNTQFIGSHAALQGCLDTGNTLERRARWQRVSARAASRARQCAAAQHQVAAPRQCPSN